MNFLNLYISLVWIGVGIAGGLVFVGYAPSSGDVETLSPTVRDNPASWRPAYAVYVRTRSTGSSGSYRLGK